MLKDTPSNLTKLELSAKMSEQEFHPVRAMLVVHIKHVSVTAVNLLILRGAEYLIHTTHFKVLKQRQKT